MSVLEEFKRRNVFRVGIAYLALGWVVIVSTDERIILHGTG